MADCIPDQSLFADIAALVEQARATVAAQANHTATRLYWQIGTMINTSILQEKRAEYGKQIVSALATQLQGRFGRTFELRNLRRMMQFADQFPNWEIVPTLSTQLAWSHFIELLPLKTMEAKLFYARVAASQTLSIKELREQIARKAFERTAIANTQLTPSSPVPQGMFKDPYLWDFLGLPSGYWSRLRSGHNRNYRNMQICGLRQRVVLPATRDVTLPYPHISICSGFRY